MRRTISGMHTIMTLEEKLEMRSRIRTLFCYQPYSAAFLFQEFAQRRDTYKNMNEEGEPSETAEDIADSLIEAIGDCDDHELHEYIIESGP